MNAIQRLALPVLLTVLAPVASADQAAPPAAFDVEAAQAILEVQEVDGWLLYGFKDQNPIANELVRPTGTPSQRWFYFVPSDGDPTALVHTSEAVSFFALPGNKIEYSTTKELDAGLRAILKGKKSVAMEYDPRSRIRSLNRVDSATVRLVKRTRVKIKSSAELVQFTKSLWGPDGRLAHYVASHHITKLRQEALSFLRAELLAGRTVTEHDVQKRIIDGFKLRGLRGPPPVVAAGRNAGNPNYVPSVTKSATIGKDQIILIDISAHVVAAKRPIFARQSWVAYSAASVPERFARIFRAVAEARDKSIEFIQSKVSSNQPVKGYEAARAARKIMDRRGYGDRFPHATGHSLDTSLRGDGANLDNYKARDSRTLVVGSGFTVGPGAYFRGTFGMRAVVSVYVAQGGIEITSQRQRAITPLLAK